MACRSVYLQSFTHASADYQQVYPLPQHLLYVSRLHSWVMLGCGEQKNASAAVIREEPMACDGSMYCF